MPVGKAPYKRGYSQSISRGRQPTVDCSFCGRKLPRHKCFIRFRGFRITDPLLKKELDRRTGFRAEKQYACPKCARKRGIVERRQSAASQARSPRRRR